MPIKWDSRLSVGNVYIDIEHKLLLSQINALEVVLRHADEKEALRFFFDQLYAFAEDHFHHEEKLQLMHMFPHYEENKKGHQQLMVELDQIKKIIYHYVDKPNTSQEEAEEISEKLNHVLRDWLVEHIIKSDMKMKGFMDNAS